MSRQDRIEAAAAVQGSHSISEITVSDSERSAGQLTEETIKSAVAQFREHGYLRINDLFTPDQMAAFDAHYRAKYGGFLSATNKKDKRPLFTVRVDGPFAQPEVLNNPLASPILAQLLGEDYIIMAMSAVASFPGAPDQYLHRDATKMFGDEVGPEIDMPVYSVTMLVPLIDFTKETGCTRVWPGSHRMADTEEGLAVGSLDPEVRTGSVLITDGRVLHRGAANNSDRVRPLFYMTFHREWYRDFGGYERRPPLDVPNGQFSRLDAVSKSRLAWSRPYPLKTRVKYWLRGVLPASLRQKIGTDT